MRKRRGLADPVGFAHLEGQIEAVVQRIASQDGARLGRILDDNRVAAGDRWRMSIAPHDDYAYAGFMCPHLQRFATGSDTPRSAIFGGSGSSG